MQLHYYGREIGPEDIKVRQGSASLVVLSIERAEVFLETPADCDALIAAAVEAKRLLDPPVPADGPGGVLVGPFDDDPDRTPEACGARPYPAGSEGDDGTECARPAGHDGKHDDNPAFGGAWCSSTSLRNGDRVYCELANGHLGLHHAPGENEGDDDITWAIDALQVTS